MDFASIRMITGDLEPMVQFYEQVTWTPVARPAPVFAELRLPSCTLAFGHAQTAQLFNSAARRADAGPVRRPRRLHATADVVGERRGNPRDSRGRGPALPGPTTRP
jgi:hypothetical protein